MESTVLSIGRSVLSGALGYASSAVAEEVALQLGIQGDHTFIRDELEMMQTFLITAHDKKDDNMVVNTWVKQVRDMSYDVEDCLWEFAVRLDKLSWWRIPCTLFDRRRVAKQMKELRAKVEDVSQRNIRYNLIKNPDSKPATIVGPSATGSATMSGMEEVKRQRDEAKRDFIRLINRKDDHLRVIGVWGESGDLGETSIIRRTYEALKTHKKFECCAWIKLMHPFDPTEFLKNIIRQFYLNSLQEAGENEKATLEAQDLRRMGMMKKRMGIMKKNDLFYEFKRYLTEKSYLIVLDDLHTIEEWGRIKTCFPNNGKGSRIIVCADQVEIASLCVGPDYIAPGHKQLGADQILHVFYEKGSQDVPNLEEAWPSSHATTNSSNSSANRNNITHLDKSIIESTFEEFLLIGRGNEKSEIIKLISRKDGQQLEVISLWGMGGIGKTALIRDIYQSQEMSSKFEKRACVTIKRPFSCDDLLRSLAAQFGYETPNPKKKKFPELESTEKIVTYLDSQLEGKKYLIVLDDLWSTKEWDSIIQYLPKRETAGSCIIVTTREENIAKHCSKEERNIKKLNILGHDDAHTLFVKKVFNEPVDLDEQYPELVEQAELILKKCEGLPLAIVTIGGFLANQSKTASEWRTLNDHISAELEMNAELETIRAILVKSYDGLPYHLKSCFLYLSLFPEDYKVSRGRLVRRWIAEGYSKEVRGKSAEDMADSYFMDLISRSMILPSKKSIYSRKGVDSCLVHDLIREIAISKSTEENLAFILEEGCNLNSQGPIRHLGVSNNWEGDRDELESMVDMSRLRSLTMFWRDWKPCFISEKMRLLRVLDMENMQLSNRQLKRIGKFRHLRYLSVRGCDHITLLPASLGKLRHLQTLDARDTNIMKLPKTILNLRELKYLSVGQKSYLNEEDGREHLPKVIRSRACIFTMICCLCCISCCISPWRCDRICTRYCCEQLPVAMAHDFDSGGALVPSGIRRLKTLHKLGVVNIAQGKTILEDIRRLTQLCKLGVTGINKENAQGFCSAISGLNRLESLSMRSVGRPGLSSCMDGTSSPPENVQSLKLLGNLVKLPEWIRGLKNLMKLKLRSSRILEHDTAIQVLGELPKLAILRLLKDSCGGEEVCLSFHQRAFPSLVVLELDDVGKLKSVTFEQEAAPMLELLQVNHGKLYKVDVGIYSGIPSLPRLKEVTIKAPNFEDGFMEELRAQLDRNPNRPLLKAD